MSGKTGEEKERKGGNVREKSEMEMKKIRVGGGSPLGGVSVRKWTGAGGKRLET